MRTVSAPGGHLRVLSRADHAHARPSGRAVARARGGGARPPARRAAPGRRRGRRRRDDRRLVPGGEGAQRRSQQAFERQNVFVADASHELRTPLAVIRANAEFLQERQPASEEAAEIVSETDRLSSLVDSLLAVARGDGNGEAAHDELDLGAVVEGSAASMRSLATERGVALDVSAAPELRIRGSREQLRQLVVILVDNALRYTGQGRPCRGRRRRPRRLGRHGGDRHRDRHPARGAGPRVRALLPRRRGAQRATPAAPASGSRSRRSSSTSTAGASPPRARRARARPSR